MKIKRVIAALALLVATTTSAQSAPSATQATPPTANEAVQLYRDLCLALRTDRFSFEKAISTVGEPLSGPLAEYLGRGEMGRSWRVGSNYLVFRGDLGNCLVYVLWPSNGERLSPGDMAAALERTAKHPPVGVVNLRLEPHKGLPHFAWSSPLNPTEMFLNPGSEVFNPYVTPNVQWILTATLHFPNGAPVIDVPERK